MKFTTLIKWTAALVVLIAGAACSKDKSDAPDGYGFVQLRIYKSASYTGDQATRADELDYLHDAAKIKISLTGSDGNTISQTVNVEAANNTLAEFGMQSEKFLLMCDTYKIEKFDVYGKLDQQLLTDAPQNPTSITVTHGGLTVQDLKVNTVGRGFAKFRLVVDNGKRTRANETADYPFRKVLSVDLKIENVNVPADVVTIKGLATRHDAVRPENDPAYYSSMCQTDSLVSLKAGTYKVTAYTTYFDKGLKVFEATTSVSENEFTVADNKTVEAEVPVTLVESKGYIKDAVALKKIWEALGGDDDISEDKWKVRWDFNRDIDLWAAQPGVQVLDDGRIAVLNLTDVGAVGEMPAELGELTELRQLYLGSHSFEPGQSKLNPTKKFTEMEPVDRDAMRRSFQETFIRNDDPLRTLFSPEMQLSFELNNVPMKKSGGQLRALAAPGNNPFNYSNLVTKLPGEINKLKRLEYLYIAFSPMAELPEDLSGLVSLVDMEIYNCPDMTRFPDGIATLPTLVSIIFSSNHNISEEEMERGLALLGDKTSATSKSLQLLQIPNQPFKIVPDLTAMERLGLLNIQNCGVTKFTAPFGKNHSLNTLNAGWNNLSELPTDDKGFFVGVEDVETIDFQHNKFTQFPDIFDSSSPWAIGEVNFSFNEITGIENGGEGGTNKGINATILSLAYNKMSDFPKDLFRSNSQLTYLQVQGNGIEKIDRDAFDGKYAHYLTTIDLSYNKLKELPPAFNNATFPYMTGVDLSYNRFEAFPHYSVLNLANLNVLIFRHQRDANGNRTMREWPVNVAQHNALRALYLGSNDIRMVSTSGALSPRIYLVEVCDNPNIVLDVSSVCPYIGAGVYYLYHDPGQDIRGCSYLELER